MTQRPIHTHCKNTTGNFHENVKAAVAPPGRVTTVRAFRVMLDMPLRARFRIQRRIELIFRRPSAGEFFEVFDGFALLVIKRAHREDRVIAVSLREMARLAGEACLLAAMDDGGEVNAMYAFGVAMLGDHPKGGLEFGAVEDFLVHVFSVGR